jgi:antitoxin component of RelBE/YafQ-DinJ toxin-antitoxin module
MVTLNIDDEVVERARKVTEDRGTSLDVIIGAFLQEIATDDMSIEDVMDKRERQANGRKWSRRDLYRY